MKKQMMMKTEIKVTEAMTHEIKKVTLDDLVRNHNQDLMHPVSGHLLYIAAPYTHPDPFWQQMRYNSVNVISALLFSKGFMIYSPLSHGVPIAEASTLAADYATWSKLCRRMVYVCDLLIVLPLPGWRQSVGVAAEIAYAQQWGMPVYELDIQDINPELPSWEG